MPGRMDVEGLDHASTVAPVNPLAHFPKYWKGHYEDVELRFCLPDIKRIMEWQGISESALERILATSGVDASGAPKLSLFVTVYVFDKNVTSLLQSQRRLEAKIREQKHLAFDDQLESKTYWNLPFNQVIKRQAGYHQPCGHSSKAKWTKKLEFESGNGRKGPKLEKLEGGGNCYAVGGQVKVLEEFSGDFSIYLEIRNSANKRAVPESCQNQGADGCGGFGSCLYCHACQAFSDVQGVRAELQLDGKAMKCSDGLKKGVYENLRLVFCLPKIDEILKSQGLNQDQFLQLLGSEQMQTQQRIESVYKKTKKSFFKDEPLPADVYWSLPFNKMIKEQSTYVACHKIYGNIKINK
ncbi:unnamed protein product, partial [Mesorhabditis spiculigera]